MRYLRIFLLHLEGIFEHRLRSLVWFLITFINPLLFLLFWRAAIKSGGANIHGWNLSHVTSYYLLLIIAGALLVSHIEEDVSRRDIAQGELVKYIIRPFPYYWIKFIQEVPWRLLQGSYGIIVFIIFFTIFGNFIAITNSYETVILTVISVFLAFMISFTFKMVLGFTAFWTTDTWGVEQLFEIAGFTLAGFIMPLEFFPRWLSNIANFTPFPYGIYYPVLIFQGRLNMQESIHVIVIQFIWLIAGVILFRFIWQAGIRKFTAVGQ